MSYQLYLCLIWDLQTLILTQNYFKKTFKNADKDRIICFNISIG